MDRPSKKYSNVVGDRFHQEVDRFQADPDGKDIVLVWSTNKSLRGAVGKIFNAEENFKGIPLKRETAKGAIFDAPRGTEAFFVVSPKETSASTPENPKHFADIYALVVEGKAYPINGGLESVVKIQRDGAQAQSQPIIGSSFSAEQAGGFPAKRMYQIAKIILSGLDVEEMPIEDINAAILETEFYDVLHFYLAEKLRREDEKSEAVGVQRQAFDDAFDTGYELREFVVNKIPAVEALSNPVKKRKLLVMAAVNYANHLGVRNDEEAALKMAMDSIAKYLG